MKCRWCGETLPFERGRGWVLGDGKVYKARLASGGVERDDHVASSARRRGVRWLWYLTIPWGAGRQEPCAARLGGIKYIHIYTYLYI